MSALDAASWLIFSLPPAGAHSMNVLSLTATHISAGGMVRAAEVGVAGQ